MHTCGASRQLGRPQVIHNVLLLHSRHVRIGAGQRVQNIVITRSVTTMVKALASLELVQNQQSGRTAYMLVSTLHRSLSRGQDLSCCRKRWGVSRLAQLQPHREAQHDLADLCAHPTLLQQ